MTELSLHILDIANNSVKAKAKHIGIIISEDTASNLLTIEITDDGCGMDAAFLAHVTDPFTTTRTTRKVGMGLSLFQAAAELTGGNLSISSEVGVGTTVTAVFVRDSIDRQPIGDMAGTMALLIGSNPGIDFVYEHVLDDQSFRLDTLEIKEILGDVAIDSPDVVQWIREFVAEGDAELSNSNQVE